VNESQTSQEITQCELDCPNGQVFTCTTLPCSVTTATSMTCNGTVTNCCVPNPNVCDFSCGLVSNGCSRVYCGPCSCPAGQKKCDLVCAKICN
jgi:hypothetical protein